MANVEGWSADGWTTIEKAAAFDNVINAMGNETYGMIKGGLRAELNLATETEKAVIEAKLALLNRLADAAGL